VRIKQRAPVTVAHLGGAPRRVHDIGEQHRRENAVVDHVSLVAGENSAISWKDARQSGS
jgi:hypothetical protein